MVKHGGQRDGRPGDHERQNRQVQDAARIVGMTADQRFAFRRAVERASRAYGEDMDFAELLAFAEAWKEDNL